MVRLAVIICLMDQSRSHTCTVVCCVAVMPFSVSAILSALQLLPSRQGLTRSIPLLAPDAGYSLCPTLCASQEDTICTLQHPLQYGMHAMQYPTCQADEHLKRYCEGTGMHCIMCHAYSLMP